MDCAAAMAFASLYDNSVERYEADRDAQKKGYNIGGTRRDVGDHLKPKLKKLG